MKKMIMLMVATIVFTGCTNPFANTTETGMVTPPTTSSTISFKTSDYGTALEQYNYLDTLNGYHDLDFEIDSSIDDGFTLKDDAVGLTMTYTHGGYQHNTMIGQLETTIDYTMGDTDKTAVISVSYDVNPSGGFYGIFGTVTTEENEVYPFAFDYGSRRIMDNDPTSDTYGNTIHFNRDLYDQLLTMLYVNGVVVTNGFNTGELIDGRANGHSEINLDNLSTDPEYFWWMEPVSFDYHYHWENFTQQAQEKVLIGDATAFHWVDMPQLTPLEHTLFILSYFKDPSHGFNHLDIEELINPLGSIVYRSMCEYGDCYTVDQMKRKEESLQWDAVGLNSYQTHNIYKYASFDDLNQGFLDVFGQTIDVDDTNPNFLSVYQKDDQRQWYVLINESSNMWTDTHGFAIINDTVDENGYGVVEFIPLVLSHYNQYWRINDIAVLDGSDLMAPEKSGLSNALVEAMEDYPIAFPHYEMTYQQLSDSDFVHIINVNG